MNTHCIEHTHGIESAGHSLPPPTIPGRARDSNSQPLGYEVPTLQPLAHDFPSYIVQLS